MKKVVLGAVVAGATAVAVKRFRSFGEGAKEPIHIRSDKHDPQVEQRRAGRPGSRFGETSVPVNAHYCGETHLKGDLCVEDLFLPPTIYASSEVARLHAKVEAYESELNELRGKVAAMRTLIIQAKAELG